MNLWIWIPVWILAAVIGFELGEISERNADDRARAIAEQVVKERCR